MKPSVHLSMPAAIQPLRERHRAEMNCQIVHDSIHDRKGWTAEYVFDLDDVIVGYGSVAVAGPWTGKPTIYELYLLPEHRTRGFDLFEALLAASGAKFLEVQSNAELLAVMLHAYGQNISTEKIVFRDQAVTSLPSHRAVMRRVTSEAESRACFAQRHGGTEWVLELDGAVVATGGIMFHYNPPYGDVYMEVAEPFRRRGLGSYFVQELKRICCELGGVPAARCDPDNTASRRTLQKAGFAPFAHILGATIGAAAPEALVR